MKQDNPFAKLGALDQKLYQETATDKPELKQEIESKSSNVAFPTKHIKKEKELGVKDTMIPRHHATNQPRHHATMTPLAQSDIIESVRKSVKQIGKEAATHRFTLEEKNLLTDIEYTYKRQGIRTSENEITRIAINFFIEDYRHNGEQSILAKILKALNS